MARKATPKSKATLPTDTCESNEATLQVTTPPLVATNKGHNMSIIQFSEDITNAEAPAPLPVGEYTAEIRSVETKVSAKGNTYMSVQFFIDSSQYPADYTEGDPDGTILTYNRIVVEDTARGRHRMKKFCESIGAKTGREVNPADWLGLTATVSVKTGEWEGEPRAEIDRVVAA